VNAGARSASDSSRTGTHGGEVWETPGKLTPAGAGKGRGTVPSCGVPDFTRPSVARVYDVLAGGYDNFAADRDEAGRLLEACPGLRDMARANRAFLGRAVTWAAGQGIAQFLDLGAGLPLRPAVHESARAVIPDARTAYVDNDLLVCSHVRAVLATDERVQAAQADLTDMSAVLGQEAVKAVIDPAEPVCLIFGLVLNLMAARRAREVVAGYADQVAPGSLVVITCARVDDEVMWKGLRAACTTASPRNHTRRTVEGFLAGLKLVPPGLMAGRGWRGGWGDTLPMSPGSVYVLAAVARKP
jgi:hypothetical protein